MINPLEKLLEWRLAIIIERFGININNFAYDVPYKIRKNKWQILNQKLASCGYFTSQESNTCYYAIKNIVWKNIINYELTQSKCHVHMLWNKNKTEHDRCKKYGYIYTNLILNIGTYNECESRQNLNILYSTIIDYLLLLNEIISHNLIHDLTNILNMYMFDVILVI